MKIKQYILTVPFLLLVSAVFGQQESNSTFYRDQMNIINPAHTGAGNLMSFSMASRNQWVGVKDAPRTQTFMFGTPYGTNSGIGLSLTNDRTFVENQSAVYIDYSYKLKFNETIDLYLGLKAGGNFLNVNLTNLETYSYDFDPNLINSKQFNPNMGVGAYLRGEKFYLSLGAPRILNTERLKGTQGIVTKATDKVHTYFSGGYDVSLSDNAVLKPSVMLRYVVGAPVSADFTASIDYLQNIEFGVSYRTDGTISSMVLLKALKWMDFGYAYENAVINRAISRVSNGSHEVFLRFNIQKNIGE